MADSVLQQLAKTDRNPAQETQYQQELSAAGIPFTVENGKANVAGFGTGGNGSDSSFFDPSAVAVRGANAANTTAFNNQVAGDKQSVTDFLTKYQGDTANVVGATSAKYNLPQQAANVNGLNTRIQDLKTNDTNEGAGGFANAGQVDAAVNSRYLPQYNSALANLNTSTTLAQNEEQTQLQPDVQGGQLLATRIASEMTGFTASQDQQLQALIDQINNGVQLTETQMNNAEKLSEAKLGYQSAIDSITAQNNKVQSVSAGSYVYNPATGQYSKLP